MTQAENRRSERVLIDVQVVVGGESADHLAFREETFTVTVSAHGALLMLANKVAPGQPVTLMNHNRVQRAGRVAYAGALHAGLAQVAIEFDKPSPEFWPIHIRPSNW
jgi:hypothetical protein